MAKQILGADIELDSSFHLFICLADLHLCLTSVENLNIVFFKSQTSGDLPEGIHIPTVDNEYGCGE